MKTSDKKFRFLHKITAQQETKATNGMETRGSYTKDGKAHTRPVITQWLIHERIRKEPSITTFNGSHDNRIRETKVSTLNTEAICMHS